MNNRITNHLPSEPDPKRNDSSDTDLTKSGLPKLPKEGTDDMANATRSDAKTSNGPEAMSGLEAELRETLEAIRGHRVTAEEVGVRHRISEDEMEVLVRAAKAIRAAVEDKTPPPVDADLVRRSAWDQLPPALSRMVVDLGLRHQSWHMAILAELNRRAEIEKAAES